MRDERGIQGIRENERWEGDTRNKRKWERREGDTRNTRK